MVVVAVVVGVIKVLVLLDLESAGGVGVRRVWGSEGGMERETGCCCVVTCP